MLPVLSSAAQSLAVRSGLTALKRVATPALTTAVKRGVKIAEVYRTGTTIYEFIESAETSRSRPRHRSLPESTDIWPARVVIAVYALAAAAYLRIASTKKDLSPTMLKDLSPPSQANWNGFIHTNFEPIAELLKSDLLIDWTDTATIRAAFFKVVHHAVQTNASHVRSFVNRLLEDKSKSYPLPDHMVKWLPKEFLLDKRFISLIATIADVPSANRVAMEYIIADTGMTSPDSLSSQDFEAPQFYAALRIALGPDIVVESPSQIASLSQMPLPTAFQQDKFYIKPSYLRAPVFLQGEKNATGPLGIFIPGKDGPFPTRADVEDFIAKRTTKDGIDINSKAYPFLNI